MTVRSDVMKCKNIRDHFSDFHPGTYFPSICHHYGDVENILTF